VLATAADAAAMARAALGWLAGADVAGCSTLKSIWPTSREGTDVPQEIRWP
jgi:hypothetical protein